MSKIIDLILAVAVSAGGGTDVVPRSDCCASTSKPAEISSDSDSDSDIVLIFLFLPWQPVNYYTTIMRTLAAHVCQKCLMKVIDHLLEGVKNLVEVTSTSNYNVQQTVYITVHYYILLYITSYI
ncbi:PREDICTED: uncharacterized protein LOC105969078 [Erythranthe guttata]|uniref:uncharacterized protein LOC105969078 n=1 Tax=Erythranthe guttata TaxID=4155 RepID=UPI00064D8273|nr:PREDICTED: uncharacterized protein LOC105969078 [Erythranthe guttata]|eukprot:XP_012849262.1 PREDICTED: uncharacterized protein LOC105969078 [Erythranthe guttata]